jgi:hypothetical protein
MTREIYDGSMKCGCGSKMEKKKIKIDGMHVRAWYCGKCKEEVLHPADAQKVLVLNKLRHGRLVKVGSLGKRLVVTIPSELARYLSIRKGCMVNAKLNNDREIVLAV